MSEPLRIEFASAGRQVSGWLCTEKEQCDITKPLPWADYSADALYLSHVLEHISSPHALQFLTECYRILKRGGTLRLVVPIVGQHLTRGHARALIDATHGHEIAFNEDLLRTFLWVAGFEPQNIQRTDRMEMDVHHLVIGEALDNTESCRLLITK